MAQEPGQNNDTRIVLFVGYAKNDNEKINKGKTKLES